jgi:hypothetical protein
MSYAKPEAMTWARYFRVAWDLYASKRVQLFMRIQQQRFLILLGDADTSTQQTAQVGYLLGRVMSAHGLNYSDQAATAAGQDQPDQPDRQDRRDLQDR